MVTINDLKYTKVGMENSFLVVLSRDTQRRLSRAFPLELEIG